MKASMLAVLNDSERLMVAETERDRLAELDEDAAIALETRVRRARNKYVSQYRRGASAAVPEHGGRGKARPENKWASMKAEAFEESLSRVSRRVASWPGRLRGSFAPSGSRPPRPPGRAAGPRRRTQRRPRRRAGRVPPSPGSPPGIAPCARRRARNSGPVPAPWAPASRRNATAAEHRAASGLPRPAGGQLVMAAQPAR